MATSGQAVRVPAPTIVAITVAEAIEKFKEDQIARGVALNTRKGYRTALDRIVKVAGPGKLMHKVTPEDVSKYMGLHADSGQGTKNNAVTRIKGFWKWAQQNKYVSPWDYDDPTLSWHHVRYEVPQRPYVEAARWPALLDVAEAVHPVYRAYVATGLYLMGRGPSELRPLKLRELNMASDQWRVGVTRQKTRSATDFMPVCGELQLEWTKWLVWYNNWTVKNLGKELQPDWYLFPTGFYHTRGPEWWPLQPDQPRSATSINSISERVLRDFGYPTRNEDGSKNRWGGSHAFRKFGARALFDELVESQGYDGALAAVREMLGHKSNLTTELYLNLKLDRIRRDKAVTANNGYMFRHNDPAQAQPVKLSTVQLPSTLVGGVLLGGAPKDALREAQEAAESLPGFFLRAA